MIAGWMMVAAMLGTQTPVQVPALRGTTFAGQPVVLPEAFKGQGGVLVIGFTQAAKTEASDWGHRLEQGDGPAVWYEMPVVAEVPKLLRGWVLKKIKESVSEKGQAHFLPVTDHEAEWKSAVGYGAADDAYVVVVDGNGVVRGRVQGAVTEAGFTKVKELIAAR